jgi:predicted metalloendopeptidase
MVDWTGILSALIPDEGIKLKPNTTIIIRAPAYFQGLNEILSTNVTLETLQEFFIISFLLAKVEFLDETSRVSLRSFAGKIGGGSTATKQRWQECVKTTSTYFPDVMGRYYVLKKFGGETEKEKIETFIDTIHQEWLHKLNFIDWLDNQTRSAAIEKVIFP